MTLATLDFIAEDSRHSIQLNYQPDSRQYVVCLDGKTLFSQQGRIPGFRRTFPLFDQRCTICAIYLGGFFSRYSIRLYSRTIDINLPWRARQQG